MVERGNGKNNDDKTSSVLVLCVRVNEVTDWQWNRNGDVIKYTNAAAADAGQQLQHRLEERYRANGRDDRKYYYVNDCNDERENEGGL